MLSPFPWEWEEEVGGGGGGALHQLVVVRGRGQVGRPVAAKIAFSISGFNDIMI